MNIQEVIQQTTRRAGHDYARKRGTEAFERGTTSWRDLERPDRVLTRMAQLGLDREIAQLAYGMVAGGTAPSFGVVGGEAAGAFDPLERIIEKSQLMSSYFLQLGVERTRAVGRIITERGEGFGTGFLISPRLLMTNNHVLEDAASAARCRVQFDYVVRPDGTIGATEIYRLLPTEFFLTSVATAALNLDYTIVAVEAVNGQGAELARRGYIPLIPTSGKLVVRDMTNIIQHPGGEPQQVALRDSEVVTSLDDFLHYEADTQPGSSGSPVFNDQWQLAALHHSGVPEEVRPRVYRLIDGGEWDTRRPLPRAQQLQLAARVKWIANEGVRVSSIVRDVRARLAGDSRRLAMFEEAIRERIQPTGEGEAGARPPAVEACLPEAATPAGSAGTVTWTIPLRVTVQLGPAVQLLGSGPSSGAAPAAAGAVSPTVVEPSRRPAPSPPAAGSGVDRALARAREALEQRPQVLEVRRGYLWDDRGITDRQAIVVVLDPRVAVDADDPYEALQIPREVEGTPVDLTLGGASAIARAMARQGQLGAESLAFLDLLQERIPPIGYEPPPGLELPEVDEAMEVTCHVSPDDGWPVLRDFLDRTERSLTIGMFDLTAPQVVAKLEEIAQRPGVQINLAIQMGMAGGLSGEKANDVPEDQVVDRLRQLMGDRLRQAYVDVIGPDRTFASSYHIKVIVRDGQEVWLSSGNLQTTNQPNIQPAEDGERRLEPLRRFNREWHIVFRNDALAATFEGYLLHDLQTAEQNPGNEPPDEEIFVPALAPAPEVELLERRRARYFRHQVFASDPGSPVRVQALLTPDNYLDHVIPLVQSARERLFIQNQSLSLLQGDRNEERFLELWGAIKERQDAGVELRMIFRVHTFDEDGARSIKERLVDFGFRPASILVQENCHTKGVVVDSAVVLVGSHNWTNQGTIANRDASLIIRQPAIARYYEAIFLFDWDTLTREPRPPRPQRGRGPGGDERLEGAPPAAGGPAATARTTIRELLDG